MIPTVNMSTYVVPHTKEKCISMHLNIFDKKKLEGIGNPGETYACDIQVKVNPTTPLRSSSGASKVQNMNSRLTWSGGMRLHQIGTGNNKNTKIVEFDSEKFKTDNIAQHLTQKEVAFLTQEAKEIMDSIATKLMYYKGKPESHKEIPNMIRDLSNHLDKELVKHELTPHKIVNMTRPQALFLARKILHQRAINNDGGELRAYLKNKTPAKYRSGKLSKKLETRQQLFGTASGLGMTAAIKTARNLYAIETAYADLFQPRVKTTPTPRVAA